ncbi:MAG: GNAT family N-acetyltransferase, partial [Microcystis sp.]
MVFWKRLFNSSEVTASPDYSGDLVEVAQNDLGQTRVFFSTDRELDLYELEELCDSVGWARRPLRKVKKAIECSFLVVSMWEVRGNRRRLVGFARATSDHAFNAT